MSIDREEANRQEAWDEAWRNAAEALGVDPNEDDPLVLDLVWDEAAKEMASQGISLPKSVSEPASEEDAE
ncbi:hypothetical protein [Burkholderia stagnalis]